MTEIHHDSIAFKIRISWWVHPFMWLVCAHTKFIVNYIDADFEPDFDWIDRVINSGIKCTPEKASRW